MDARTDNVLARATELDAQDADVSVATSRLYSVYGVNQAHDASQRDISEDMIHQTTNRGSNLSHIKGCDA